MDFSIEEFGKKRALQEYAEVVGTYEIVHDDKAYRIEIRRQSWNPQAAPYLASCYEESELTSSPTRRGWLKMHDMGDKLGSQNIEDALSYVLSRIKEMTDI